MADGWSRVSGRPGVCLVISGPGLTNVLTLIAQARQDARPLLVLSASVSRDERGRGRGVIHDLPGPGGAHAGSDRLTVSIDEPDELGPALDAAWAVLEGRLGPPGPVHLQVPVDVLRLTADATPRLSRAPACGACRRTMRSSARAPCFRRHTTRHRPRRWGS